MDEQKVGQMLLTLAEGLVKAGDDIRALHISLRSVQTIRAAQVNPANPEAMFLEILERDRLAQSLGPAPHIDTLQAMIETLKFGNWGQA